MPLVFYLKIDEEDNFFLSPDRTFTSDKGHGTVGSSGDTYMLIYSDSTPDAPKTSTFEVEEGNLHFQTALSYGASSLPASKEDESNPEIIYYLIGTALVYEDYYGEYAGSHTVSAMGSEIVYDYALKLSSGRMFEFTSNFVMGDEPYEYQETGFYDVEADELTLYVNGEEVVGQFDDDMNLTIAVKASEMGAREERVLQVATTAACANTYYGRMVDDQNETPAYDIDIVLVLDKFGGYSFTATDLVNGEVTETGEFSFDNGDIVFSPADVSDQYTATLVNYVFNGAFELPNGSSERTEVTLYCNTIQGTFSGEGEDELENAYQATLVLNADGSFSLLLEQDDTVLIDQVGTFSVRRMIFTQLVLTAEDETVYELVISDVGLNVNFTLADETEIGFILTK